MGEELEEEERWRGSEQERGREEYLFVEERVD